MLVLTTTINIIPKLKIALNFVHENRFFLLENKLYKDNLV